MAALSKNFLYIVALIVVVVCVAVFGVTAALDLALSVPFAFGLVVGVLLLGFWFKHNLKNNPDKVARILAQAQAHEDETKAELEERLNAVLSRFK